MTELVVLVDREDRVVGTAEKMQAHHEGWLHRAFSVVVFNHRGEVLLQRRHPRKYHSGGLWSNTCCSHPRPGEGVEEAARRRLEEEMGFVCELRPAGSFVYRVAFEDDVIEHEFDHVLVGVWNGEPVPNRSEVIDWRWMAYDSLVADIARHPNRYTYWFRVIVERLLADHDVASWTGTDSAVEGGEFRLR